jgi:hypothetical protein
MRKIKIQTSIIQRWFQKRLERAYSNQMSESSPPTSQIEHFYFHKGVNIKVFFASNGGKIVKINKFNDDMTPDQVHLEKLYIINEEEDFGQSINKIVTMEALR